MTVWVVYRSDGYDPVPEALVGVYSSKERAEAVAKERIEGCDDSLAEDGEDPYAVEEWQVEN